MPGLLVSVRDASEAQIALQGGADLIDIKEPNRGSLGAATVAVVEAIVAAVAGRVPISVALGELRDAASASQLCEVRGVEYAKLGLSRAGPNWHERWREVLRGIPASAKAVAVAYADWRPAGARRPEALYEAAREARCAAFLLDTYDKSSGNLFDWMTPAAVAALIHRLRLAGITTVVGGSLDEATWDRAMSARPDYLAVRGAVCRGGRRGTIDPQAVRHLAARVRGPASQMIHVGCDKRA